MKLLLTTLSILVASQAVYAETVTFWDGEATLSTDGKYHGGLNFTQDKVYVEYVSAASGELGGGTVAHIGGIDGQQCEMLNKPTEGLLLVPKLGPRAKLKSMKFRFRDRYSEGRRRGEVNAIGAKVTLYVWVGNKGSLEPTSTPGGDGWLSYELERNQKFDTLDFQAQSSPPPRGQRYYITTDDQGTVFIDDIEVGK